MRGLLAGVLPDSRDDRATLALLAWCAVALIAAEFLILPFRTATFWLPFLAARASTPPWQSPELRALVPQLWWTMGQVVLWVGVPTLLFRRTRATPFSIGLPRTSRGLLLYLGMIAVMSPVIVVMSARPEFLRTYPLVHPVAGAPLTWSLLLPYWVCYATILFTTEYFFRGVLLFALEPKLGKLAIAVSVMPYALVHVHKPAPEAFASIAAGYILGYFALTTRSIGGGVLVHCAVAIGMDAMALTRNGAFPTSW